jgi:hypothetical protein
MKPSPLLLVVVTTLSITPAGLQTVKLTDDGAAIVRSAARLKG